MNNDLISREALLKQSQRMTEYDEAGWGVPVRVVKTEYIETAPAVDAVEVKIGRWEYHWFDAYCSVCGYENKADRVTRLRNDHPYCPNCGARMDGE